MTMPRAASLLVGLFAGLFVVPWLGSSATGLSIVQAVAVLTSATAATLATAMGGLIVSDWQADIQSRRDWAQLGLMPAELSASTQVQTAWDIDPSYQNSADNEALLDLASQLQEAASKRNERNCRRLRRRYGARFA